MNDLSQNPIYNKVRHCNTERELFKITENYNIVNGSEVSGVLGYIYIFEGRNVLCVPYGDVLVNNSYEQLFMDYAFEPTDVQIATAIESINNSLQSFKHKYAQYLSS